MLNLLLLLGLVIYSETSTISVSGEKGGSVTLSCEFEDNEISDISLNNGSEVITVCQTEECSGRVFKQGNCDVVFKDLCFSDAGTYMLNIYYSNDQAELERQIRTYQLHIHDDISEDRRNTEWTEVWSRTDGVQRERITIRDRNLIINEFTDAGTYRVLDPDEEILITVTVTESGTESKEKMYNTDYVKSNDAIYNVIFWIVIVGLHVLALVIYIVPCVKKHLCQETHFCGRWKNILTNGPQCKGM